MKKPTLKIIFAVILIPVIIIFVYFGWQFSWSQIHTANCANLNKEYSSKTYTLKSNPEIEMQVDGLYNPKISSTYESTSGLFFYPGIKYGCSVTTTKDFYYNLKFNKYPNLKVYYQGELFSSYNQQKIDYDNVFEQLLNKNNNWDFTEFENGAFLKSQTGTFVNFGEGLTVLNTSSAIFIYTNSEWGKLDLRRSENVSAFKAFLNENNLLKSSFVSFNPFDMEKNADLNVRIFIRTDNRTFTTVDGTSTDLVVKFKLSKVDSEYIIESIYK